MKGRRSSVHLSLPSVTHLRLVSVTRPSLPPLAYGSFRREWNERRIRDVEGASRERRTVKETDTQWGRSDMA